MVGVKMFPSAYGKNISTSQRLTVYITMNTLPYTGSFITLACFSIFIKHLSYDLEVPDSSISERAQ